MKDVLQSNKTEVHHFTLELAPQKWEVKKKEKQDGKEEGLVLVRQEREKKIERDPIF